MNVFKNWLESISFKQWININSFALLNWSGEAKKVSPIIQLMDTRYYIIVRQKQFSCFIATFQCYYYCCCSYGNEIEHNQNQNHLNIRGWMGKWMVGEKVDKLKLYRARALTYNLYIFWDCMSSNLREVVFQADNSTAIFFSSIIIITQIESIHLSWKTTEWQKSMQRRSNLQQ